MHILVLNVFFAPHSYGGATVVAEQVARSLVRDFGHQVTAISAMARTDFPAYATLTCETGGIRNIMINMPPGRSYADHYANPQVAERIAAIARSVAPDLAHVHCVQEIGADCIAVLKAQGVPVVLSTHDFWWLCERQFMIRGDGVYCGQDPIQMSACKGCVDDFARASVRADRLAALGGMADLVTAPSVFAKGLHHRSGFVPDRLVVWENGVQGPGRGFFEAQAKRRARDPRTVFGFVGGPSRIKGWPLLEAAFDGLGRSDFRGIVVEGSLDGSWWPERSLDRLDGDWSVHPRYGPDDMDAFIAEIDVLLFLSQWKETFGLTIREALGRGIRVIQTDAGGTMEHGQDDAVQVLPIGCAPRLLREAIEVELARDERGCSARPARDFKAQAEAFLALTCGLTAPDLSAVVA